MSAGVNGGDRRPSPTTPDLLELLRGRALAIAGANVPLLVVVWLTVKGYYPTTIEPHLNAFTVQVLIVCVVGFIVSSDKMFSRMGRAFKLAPGNSALRANETVLRVSAFLVLLGIILLDFYAVGRIIQATGGITVSPYFQFAATMLILGGLMTDNKVSQLLIFIGGIAFFIMLSSTSWVGEAPKDPGEIRNAAQLIIIITALNLVISFFVNNRTRTLSQIEAETDHHTSLGTSDEND